MPTRDDAPIGAPCWIDLFTSDMAGSRRFYEQLFGWTAEEPNEEFGGYVNFQREGARVAGAMTNSGEDATPDRWSVYLAVEDAEQAVEAVQANGGQVFVPAMDVGDLGRMAVTADVGGAAIGLWQPGTHRGFTTIGEPGAPSWFELHTRDYESTIEYYRNTFGLGAQVESDTAEFRYSTLTVGDDPVAGVMDATDMLADGAPPQWVVYFGVDDCEAALARVGELGGSILSGPEDSPYGRLATIADPTGAQCKLVDG